MSVSVLSRTDENIENDPHYRERCDLAAVFRWSARLHMHEGVANHFSLAVDAHGSRFLMNPMGKHFSRMCASDLLLLDAHDETTMQQPDAPDPTAWAIHGAMHRNVPHARCVLHLHPKYSTVLAALADSVLPPIDQNTMRYYQRLTVDDGFDGMGLGDEAERLTKHIGENVIVVMGNHGVMSVAESVARAFDELYYFERACQTWIEALQTGRPLRIASHEVAHKTCRQWLELADTLGRAHLREIRAILDAEEPEYAG